MGALGAIGLTALGGGLGRGLGSVIAGNRGKPGTLDPNGFANAESLLSDSGFDKIRPPTSQAESAITLSQARRERSLVQSQERKLSRVNRLLTSEPAMIKSKTLLRG